MKTSGKQISYYSIFSENSHVFENENQKNTKLKSIYSFKFEWLNLLRIIQYAMWGCTIADYVGHETTPEK